MRFEMKAFFRVISMVVGAGLVMVQPAPVHAQEFIKNALEGMGLVSSSRPDIDYTERAPLVVPPKAGAAELPPVQEPGSVARSNPAWPTDPDVERRRKQEEEDNLPASQTYKSYLNRENPWISPDELRGNRRAGAGRVTEPATQPDGRDLVNPDELRRGNPALAGQKTFQGEPQRRRLTDPPSGYRTPASSAPYAGGTEAEPEKKSFWRRLNPF